MGGRSRPHSRQRHKPHNPVSTFPGEGEKYPMEFGLKGNARLRCRAGGAVRLVPAADALMIGCDGGVCVSSGIRGARGAP